ncbi:FARP1 [Cordylochernes scorpioides]|uniref:FARP1 n=1 Tax=Cordylochernes scorpioides TaxID=51811 RepID=A0ABY6KB63_9ARAC|nr:FARP1 [Cordylochernes scorpioides]
MVVYTSRAASQLQFRCHGQVRLSAALTVEETSSAEMEHSFSLAGEGFVLQLGAAGPAERKSWVTDLRAAIARAPSRPSASLLSGLRSSSCSSERLDRSMEGDLALSSEGLPPQAPKQRSNTTVHVCWHRSITLGRQDYARAVSSFPPTGRCPVWETTVVGGRVTSAATSYASSATTPGGRSSGWCSPISASFSTSPISWTTDVLWQDEFPLASLPVLGYTVTAPSNQDNITKEHVFKIQYKTHAYFFRAESDYPYSR